MTFNLSKTVISVEHLSKYYRLGVIGGATFREEFSRWWARRLGRPDPYAKIGQADHGNRAGEHIWALRDIDLEVREGEILGVIGRNGAGKSTLLKILSRITAPTSGRAVIRGRVGSLLEVGTGFHPELTGRENIYLNGTLLGMSRAEVGRKLEEIVEFAEMGAFIDTPVKRYSSGMTVRLAFAVAAHLEPEILIVDEVLAVGDAAFQKKCLGKMQDVAGQGRTVLFVSHQLNMITSLCTRAILLNSGKVFTEGMPSKIVEQYLRGEDVGTSTKASSLAVSAGNQFLKKALAAHADDLEMPDNLFSFYEDIVVRVAYVVPGASYFVAATMDDSRGVRIFSHRDMDVELVEQPAPGAIAEARLIIPGSLFSPDFYTLYIDVDTLAHGRSDRHETLRMSFEITEDGFNFIGSRSLKSNRPVLWPKFTWQKMTDSEARVRSEA